ncbi:hypothetical protein D3C76_197580 [compost metagenome]
MHGFEVLERCHFINKVKCIHIKVRVDLHLEMLVLCLLHSQLFFVHIDFERLDLPGHLVKGLGHDREFRDVRLCGQPDVQHAVAELAHPADESGKRPEQETLEIQDIAGDDRNREQGDPKVEHFLEEGQIS